MVPDVYRTCCRVTVILGNLTFRAQGADSTAMLCLVAHIGGCTVHDSVLACDGSAADSMWVMPSPWLAASNQIQQVCGRCHASMLA